MPFAARLGDPHTCPRQPPGGTITHGASSVMIEDRPAARKGDACDCADGPSHLGSGSRSVTIEDQPAARVGDTTCHHGEVIVGASSVIVGDASSFPDEGGPSPARSTPAASTSAMTTARTNGAPFVRP